MRQVRVNVFDYDNRVVNHQPDRSGHASEGHQVETQTGQPHCQKSHQHRDRNYQNRDKRCAPIAQESEQDCHREQQANQDRIAHGVDRLPDQQGLIVVRRDANIFWQFIAHRRQLGLYLVNDGNAICIRLAIDVDQHGRLPVGSDNCVLRFNSRTDRRNVRKRHGSVVNGCDHNAVEFLRFFCLAADQRQFELMVLLDQSGRGQDV